MSLSMAVPSGSWRQFCADPDRVDAGLRDALDGGAPIVLTSRFSTPSGDNARTSSINSLYESARVLARQSGIDVSALLPDADDLDLRLRNAPVTRSERLREGSDIRHRFVTVDLRPVAPVVLLLATGTGRIAAKGFIQPFTHRAAELVWKVEAAVLATKRWDRTNRNDDLVGPLFTAMSERHTWVCTDRLFRQMNDETRVLLMVESFAARSNTGGEDHAKRLGQADRTGRQVVGGQVAYHLPQSPPPGVGVATMRRRPNLAVERIAYLDMAGCRPDAAEVADGLSEVVGDDGRVVDQVAAVRLFLAHYGDPGWMDGDRLWRQLVSRRLSTVHLRARFGAGAHVASVEGARSAGQTILRNLEVYERGVLRRSPGGEVPPFEIAGFVPPDGPWATPEDFARIRGYLARGRRRSSGRVRLALAGIEATYNGVPCRTRSYGGRSTITGQEPCLGFRRVRDDGQEVRVDDHVLLPWSTFTESVADGIIGAGDQALQPLVDQAAAAVGSDVDDLARRVEEVDGQIDAVRRRKDGLVAQLGEVGDDGRPLLRGTFLQAAQQEYEAAHAQLVGLEEERDGLVARQPAETRGVDVGAAPALLPQLLASLRDPADHHYAGLWRRVVRSLSFSTSPGAADGASARRLEWHGAVHLDVDGQGTVTIPFEGAYEYRRQRRPQDPAAAARRHIEQRQQFVDAMREGVPYEQIPLPRRHVTRPRVAELLGVDAGHPLFACDDPRIVAAAVGLLLDAPPAHGAGFLSAVRRVHVDDRSARPWRRPVAPSLAAFYELAAADGTTTVEQLTRHLDTAPGTIHTLFSRLRNVDPNWTSLRKRGYRLAACHHCGNHDRRPAVIAEIDGLLCLACGHDQADVHWPPATYRQYTATGPTVMA